MMRNEGKTADKPASAERSDGIRHGDASYRRAVLALFATGLASFNAIYCTQALMPALSEYFDATDRKSVV